MDEGKIVGLLPLENIGELVIVKSAAAGSGKLGLNLTKSDSNNSATFMKYKMITIAIAAASLFASDSRAADTYIIDPAHTQVGFSVKHLGINNVKGKFNKFAGSIVLENGTIKEASGTIQVSSVDTGVQQRDDHLRSPDFFDATNYPTITFKTRGIRKEPVFTRHRLPDGRITMVADFTMHGITKEIRLPAREMGPAKDPWGTVKIGLEANPSSSVRS